MAEAANAFTTSASRIDRANVMRRAWSIFRDAYRYPVVPFRSIGRQCFTYALRKAWADTREAARCAAMPVEVRQSRMRAIEAEMDMLPYRSLRYDITAMRRKLEAELSALATA